MKRALALLLVFIITVSACSCGKSGNTGAVSEREDEIPSVPLTEESLRAENSAEEISEELSEEEISVPECEKKAEIDARFHGEVDRTLERRNVLAGKSYTFSGKLSSAYTGTEKTLSDGVIPYSFNRYSWLGIESGTTDIVFDLGEVTENIGAMRAVCLSQNAYGIYLPQSVTVYCSEDGKDYIKICKMNSVTGINRAEVYSFDFNLQEYVSARYIKFSLISSTGLVFLCELEAYVYGEGRDDSLDLVPIYPEYTVPRSELIYRENGSAQETNLALGAEVHAVAFSTVEKKNVNETSNVQDTSILCDSKRSDVAAWDADYAFRITRGDGREIIFDLGYTASVQRFAAQAVYKPSWGVYPPDEIGVCVSADGVEWQSVAVMKVPEDKLNGSEKMIEFAAETDLPYRARYVMFAFLFTTHTAFTEFEIFGTEKVPESALMPDNSKGVSQMPYSFPASGSLGGAQNVLCSYLCATQSHCGVYETMLTAEDYLNIIGYYEDGELKDAIFDSMVVTPHGNFAPEGKKETLEGWAPFFETLFTKDRGLEAISQAAAEIGKAKGEANYKEKIFLSVIHPFATVNGKTNAFGDIDGDNVNESFDSLENRKKVIRWQVDMQLARLAEIDAPNIELLGFYWLSEALYFDEPDEIEIVRYAIDYVHGKGYLMFWIPYYNASGWNTWKEMGFDFACLQPNYSFTSTPDPDRLYTTALKARLYGMSVEIELADPAVDENVKIYKEYLAAGKEYGYMYSPKVYYLGGVPSDLTAAKNSGYEYEHSIYEDTYLYSKCQIPEDYDPYMTCELAAPVSGPVSGSEGKRISGSITVDSQYNHTIVITVQPKYGSVQLVSNGKYVYIPEKGFYGEDHFCVAAKYLSGQSEETRIDITVRYVPEE